MQSFAEGSGRTTGIPYITRLSAFPGSRAGTDWGRGRVADHTLAVFHEAGNRSRACRMSFVQLPNWQEAPNSLLEADGHCGLLAA